MSAGLKFHVPAAGEDQEEYVLMPTADYRLRITKIEDVEDNFNPGQRQFKWTFTVDERNAQKGKFNGTTRLGWTGQKLGTYVKDGQTLKTKGRIWLEAALGRELEDGADDIGDAEIVGNHVMGSIGIVRNKEGNLRNKILTIWPEGGSPQEIPAATNGPQQQSLVEEFEDTHIEEEPIDISPKSFREKMDKVKELYGGESDEDYLAQIELVGKDRAKTPWMRRPPEERMAIIVQLQLWIEGTDIPF